MQKRFYALLPAAALLLAALLSPLPGMAQGDPTATPTAAAMTAATATPTAAAALAATMTATATATATVNVPVTPTLTTPATATPTAAPAATAAMTVTETVTETATATVTATVTATGTPTPAAAGALTATSTLTTAAPGAPGTAVVRTSPTTRLRVRSGPGTGYPIVARLDNGQLVSLLGRDAGGGWLLVALGGQTSPLGWASATYLATSTNVAQLPVSDITTPTNAGAPPVPVATATRRAQAVTPAPGDLPGKLAVPVFDPNQGIYNIWLVDANGANLRRVVENASSPALSADGTLLAYRHWQRDDRGIVVANSDGSNPWRLTDKLEDVLPSFSPDKSKIVFSTYRQGDRLSRLYYVWTDEQNRRAWEWGAGGLFGEDPDWMADGQIAYHTGGETAQLWLMNGDATNQRPFFRTDSIAAIAASPDSRTVAYMGDSGGGNWDIYTVGVDGETARRLTDDGANDGLPAWSPDGTSIAFVSDRTGQWALWVMDADGDNQRLLAWLPGPVDGRVQFEPDYLNHGWLEEQIAWSR